MIVLWAYKTSVFDDCIIRSKVYVGIILISKTCLDGYVG